MAKARMDLSAFVGKLLEEQDGDVRREGIRVLSQALMEAEVAASIEAGFVVTGKLLHAVAEVQQPEMPGPDVTPARAGEELAAALEHVDAHVVDERASHLS
jgi:hypothetical protein